MAVDVEDWLTTEATTALGVAVSDGAPSTLPAQFVVITRTGGPRDRVSDRPQVTIDTYARSATAAVALANRAGDWFLGLSGRHAGPPALIVYGTALAGMAKLPDPRSPQHVRYSQTGTLHLRGRRTA